jgi:hypothetical protein
MLRKKPTIYGTNVLIDHEHAAGSHVGILTLIIWSTKPLHINKIQLFANTNLSDRMQLLAAVFEYGKLKLKEGGCSKGRRKIGFGEDVCRGPL